VEKAGAATEVVREEVTEVELGVGPAVATVAGRITVVARTAARTARIILVSPFSGHYG
jgi:hypothetical protein